MFTRPEYGSTEPLRGLPENSPGPTLEIRQAAQLYAEQVSIPYREPSCYVTTDPERGARIAQAYEAAKHAPDDPKIKAAYDALIKETFAQYQAVKDLGITIEAILPGMENPYPNGSLDMIADLRAGHLWFFPTESGYGPEGAISDHPMLAETSERLGGRILLANDVFRIVHDIFGHAKEGVSFGPDGEENAWQIHRLMYSDRAARAMTAETRGQNSWVNFGPQGEANRANPEKTVYAEQKATLLPEWVSNEGVVETKTRTFEYGKPPRKEVRALTA